MTRWRLIPRYLHTTCSSLGASGSLFAVLSYYTLSYPDSRILFLFFIDMDAMTVSTACASLPASHQQLISIAGAYPTTYPENPASFLPSHLTSSGVLGVQRAQRVPRGQGRARRSVRVAGPHVRWNGALGGRRRRRADV